MQPGSAQVLQGQGRGLQACVNLRVCCCMECALLCVGCNLNRCHYHRGTASFLDVDPAALPHSQRDLHEPAKPAGTGGTDQDLR